MTLKHSIVIAVYKSFKARILIELGLQKQIGNPKLRQVQLVAGCALAGTELSYDFLSASPLFYSLYKGAIDFSEQLATNSPVSVNQQFKLYIEGV
jgi:hypothetical protein